MNGQLSEHPPAELISEISAKSLGGRLQLEHDRVKVVAYFDHGNFLYAASNLRSLRLREYLKKGELVSDQDLAKFNERVSDTELAKTLCAQKLLSPSAAEQVQARLAADVLRLVLSWTEGSWEFDSRSRLNEQLDLKIDINALLLEAARRLPPDFVASRFGNSDEVITPELLVRNDLLPAEAFLLSRLDRPTTLRELIAVSGVGEEQVLGIVYSLAIAGVLKREDGPSAFRGQRSVPLKTTPPPARDEVSSPPPPPQPARDTDPQDLETFLLRVKNAKTHYEVLDVAPEASSQELKTVYYQLARRYHPDRFRKADEALMGRIQSAFARITQGYDTLRDDTLRANYNAKIAARKKAEQLADSAPKAATTERKPEPVADANAEPETSAAERAESQFKEGFAALELGQRKVALSLFASASRAVPNEPRYRAFYGQMLAANEATRRSAEAELNAAIKLDPRNAEYRVMLAELYRDLGLKLRAKGEAERAVAADPNNRKARELLRGLE